MSEWRRTAHGPARSPRRDRCRHEGRGPEPAGADGRETQRMETDSWRTTRGAPATGTREAASARLGIRLRESTRPAVRTRRSIGRHRDAQRSTPVDDGQRRRSVAPEVFDDRVDVFVQPAFGGPSAAQTIAAVVEREHGVSFPGDARNNRSPDRQIAAVAVEVEDVGASGRSGPMTSRAAARRPG